MFEKWGYTHLQAQLFEKATVFEVKPGDLVVYTDRTLHGSFLDNSKKRDLLYTTNCYTKTWIFVFISKKTTK
jgi:hypothetical protein